MEEPLDIFLNILLFVPFGFGLAEKLLERERPTKLSFILTLFAGFLFSYTIEFLQIYIPSRDSGWEDVFTNSAGAMTGFFVFERWGRETVRFFSKCESLLAEWLTIRSAVVILSVYFVAWFVVSIRLQQRSLLTNWDPNSFLVIGNDAEAQYPWRGKVSRLQFWARALPPQLSHQLTHSETLESAQKGLNRRF